MTAEEPDRPLLRRLAGVPHRVFDLNRAWWSEAAWPERLARLSVIAGLATIMVMSFTAIGAERRPSIAGLIVGAALLLAAAPLRWRSSGYVWVLGFAVFFPNNACIAADASWNGGPLALTVLALFALAWWMGDREDVEGVDASAAPAADAATVPAPEPTRPVPTPRDA